MSLPLRRHGRLGEADGGRLRAEDWANRLLRCSQSFEAVGKPDVVSLASHSVARREPFIFALPFGTPAPGVFMF
jgi:hypothetical protein